MPIKYADLRLITIIKYHLPSVNIFKTFERLIEDILMLIKTLFLDDWIQSLLRLYKDQ